MIFEMLFILYTMLYKLFYETYIATFLVKNDELFISMNGTLYKVAMKKAKMGCGVLINNEYFEECEIIQKKNDDLISEDY